MPNWNNGRFEYTVLIALPFFFQFFKIVVKHNNLHSSSIVCMIYNMCIVGYVTYSCMSDLFCFPEITHRFQTARPAVRQLLLQYLLPWLYNMELVDPNVPPANPLSYFQVSQGGEVDVSLAGIARFEWIASWMSERKLRFDELGNLFFRRLSGCLYHFQSSQARHLLSLGDGNCHPQGFAYVYLQANASNKKK